MAATTITRKVFSGVLSQSFKVRSSASVCFVQIISSPSTIKRFISLTASHPPRRGMITQPLSMGNPYYDEDLMQERLTTLHLEAMESWKEEAKALTDAMVFDDIPEGGNHPVVVNKETENQVQCLYEELIENDLFDPRLTWTAKVDY